MNKFLKLSWPHAVAILSLVILSSVYFSPLWQGYDLDQNDIVQWRGMSQELSNYRELHNEEALWSNSMFGGMPAYQVSTEHNANLLRPILLVLRLGLPGAIGTLFLCFLGYYILGLCLRLGPWYSLVGSIAFGFATITILYLGAGHTGKVTSIAFLAPTLGGFILAFRGRAYLGGAIFMLFLGLNIAANHLQMTYYLAFLLVAVAVGESIRLVLAKQFKALGMSLAVLAVASVVAVLPSASNLMTTFEYSKYTTRGSSDLTLKPKESSNIEQEGLSGSYILDYNFASGEQWSLLIPNAKGGASSAIGDKNKDAIPNAAKGNKNVNKFKDDLKGTNSYWGAQRFTGGAFYFGAAIMTLFILAFVGLKDGIKWPFLVITLLALGLCLKEMTGLNSMFIEKIPMYNKFRDSKMILVLIQVMAAAMGMMFLKKLVEGEIAWGEKGKKILTGAVALFAIVIMFLYVSPSSTGTMISPQEQEQFDQMAKSGPKEQAAMVEDYSVALQDVRAEIFKADAKRSLFLVILISGGVLALLYVKKDKLKLAILPIVGVIVLFDGFSVSRRYLNLEKEKGAYKKFVTLEEKEIPVKPSAADFSILDLEKPAVADFDNKSNALEQALTNSGIYDHVKTKGAMKEVANFGTLQLNSDFRVARLGNPFNDAETSFFHKSIGGYHGAKLKRIQEVIDFHLAEELDSALAYLQAGTYDSLGGSLSVLNMLNTKYYIGNPEQPAIPNKFAMGNAWFVSQVKTTNNSDEEIVALGEIDAKLEATTQTIFTTQFHAPQSAVDSTASVRMLAYETKVLRYEVNNTSAEAQPVVFSEIYYPEGWICRIDGNEVDAARVNYVLRGAMVPAGTHTVEWSFEPKVWEKGTTISYAGSALLFALLGLAGFMVYKEEKKA
jgi:MFS family permease